MLGFGITAGRSILRLLADDVPIAPARRSRPDRHHRVHTTWEPNHPVPALALHGRGADVTMVIVDGRVVVEHGELVGVDEAALADAARSAR